MLLLTIALSLIGAGVLALGIVTIVRSYRDRIARFFFLTTVGACGWSVGIGVFFMASRTEVALPAVVAYYAAAALIAVSMTSLGIATTAYRVPQWFYVVVWLPFFVFVAAITVAPSLLIEEIRIMGQQHLVSLNGQAYLIYQLGFIIYYIAGVLAVALGVKQHTGDEKVKMIYLVFAYSCAGMIGVWFNLLLPGIGNYSLIWCGPLGICLFIPVVYIAIVKYGLFDAKLAIARAIVYIFTLLTLGIVYAGVMLFLYQWILPAASRGPIATEIMVMLLLALIFQPLKRFFDRVTNKVLYRNKYREDIFHKNINTLLVETIELEALISNVARRIARTMQAKQVFVCVRKHDQLVIAGTNKHKTLTKRDVDWLDKLIRNKKLYKKAILRNRLLRTPIDKQVYQLLAGSGLAIVVPLIMTERPIGYLCIGDRIGGLWTQRDVDTLGVVANGLGIAIQNSLSVEEIRQFNTTLQQRIEVATRELRETNLQLQRLDETKDEFISMASHQLRTPLTSIKGYISMLLDGDAGRVSAMQRRFLAEAFASSDRMVHLINDFLNVSRLRTGKFVLDRQPVDFLAIVREEVEGLQPIADQRQLEVVLRAPDVGPIITIDEHKLRQVVMNLIDNAIYYTRIESQILVKVAVSRRSVVLTVTDQGIGVPADEQPRLFGKFFRATNARRQRPDGTGIGLFLAQQVVAAHGGHMIFSSTEGKGSTFGFRLPRQ